MNITVVQSCGYTYLHVGSPPIVTRIDHLDDSHLHSTLTKIASQVRIQETSHQSCLHCHVQLVRRGNESITNYDKRQFCSVSCAQKHAPGRGGQRLIRRVIRKYKPGT